MTQVFPDDGHFGRAMTWRHSVVTEFDEYSVRMARMLSKNGISLEADE
jgi:hypothetical protein